MDYNFVFWKVELDVGYILICQLYLMILFVVVDYDVQVCGVVLYLC